MDFKAEPSSLILEIARWTAPAFLVGYVVSGVHFLYVAFRRFFYSLCFQKKMVVIYGENEKTKILGESMSKNFRPFSSQTFLKAPYQVIMFDSVEKNLRFLMAHKEEFPKESKVYVQLEQFSPYHFSVEGVHIFPFSFAEITAFQFIRKQGKKWCEEVFRHKKMDIVLIGSGEYAEKLLDYCANLNIFHDEQEITYHIFGDFSRYKALHYGLPQEEKSGCHVKLLYNHHGRACYDRFCFYQDSWEEHCSLLPTAFQVVICEEDELVGLSLANQLQSAFPSNAFSLALRLSKKEFLNTENHLEVFGNYDEICSSNFLLQNELLNNASKQQQNYLLTIEQDVIKKEENWHELNSFTRNSNLFSTRYRMSNLSLVMAEARAQNIEQIAEFLSTLEHIRWCRFHNMYNWTQDRALREKDLEQRIHFSIVDYELLTDDEKEFDCQVIEALLRGE